MGFGFSRDDVETSFFSRYLELGVFGVSPFESIDRDGVGRLVRLSVQEGRDARPGLKTGVCGEHGGDPDSIHFFARWAGLRVLLAVPGAGRPAGGGRAALESTVSDTR
jgi:pyruvate,orthophosphate dikinase